MPGVINLTVEISEKLKGAIVDAAAAESVSLTDFVSNALAAKVGKAELGGSPRTGRPGRKPSKTSQVNGTNGHSNGKHKKAGK